MNIDFKDFIHRDIQHNGFILKPRDAFETAQNIEMIFLKNARWFRRPEPVHYLQLRKQYKTLMPQMEQYHPGVVDRILQPEILRQMGFPVDSDGMVEYPL